MLWFGLLSIGTRAKRFDLVRLLSEREQNNIILVWKLDQLNSISENKIILYTWIWELWGES